MAYLPDSYVNNPLGFLANAAAAAVPPPQAPPPPPTRAKQLYHRPDLAYRTADLARGLGGSLSQNTLTPADNPNLAPGAGGRGHWDPASGIFVQNPNMTIGQDEKARFAKTNALVNDQGINLRLMQANDLARQAMANGAGVRPGVMPSMNAVQASRLQSGQAPGMGLPGQMPPPGPVGPPMGQGIGGSVLPNPNSANRPNPVMSAYPGR